ncbi:hypothetical protein OCU04_006345 [Sclerotinia nivalis]|uniref:Uncharacterized protein n=1 Tax=Sclerotinia nivalis TaxID=352851 RepID=A0A9X0DM38_9HELO|nr:hypothetical protein OCU04_006345 [Sclerotinia nivalis]
MITNTYIHFIPAPDFCGAAHLVFYLSRACFPLLLSQILTLESGNYFTKRPESIKMATSNFAENAVGYLIYALIARCLLVYGYRIFVHPLHSYPGLFIAKFTDWYGGYHAFFRRLHLVTYRDHQLYGAAIRQGPNKLVFNTVTALHEIIKAIVSINRGRTW